MGDYKIGQTVQFGDDRQGIIRWLGKGSFSPGEWVGLELPDDSGKNDGSVKGERYFECAPGHGMMIRPDAIVTILKQPAPPSRPKPPNGTATKPRPSSGITADVARKRQSLMSGGSTPGSRPSIRVSDAERLEVALANAMSVSHEVSYKSDSLFCKFERIYSPNRNTCYNRENLRFKHEVAIEHRCAPFYGPSYEYKASISSLLWRSFKQSARNEQNTTTYIYNRCSSPPKDGIKHNPDTASWCH
jgi:hypothetical protein